MILAECQVIVAECLVIVAECQVILAECQVILAECQVMLDVFFLVDLSSSHLHGVQKLLIMKEYVDLLVKNLPISEHEVSQNGHLLCIVELSKDLD